MGTSDLSKYAEDRMLLSDVPWNAYVALTDGDGIKGARLTYQRGSMELTHPSFWHERLCVLLRRMVCELTYELDMPICGYGSTTLRRPSLQCGLDPDNCYYIEHEAQMRTGIGFDLEVDPPPDLAVEVDISESSISKLGVYAELRVPEVWQCDGKELSAFVLKEDGRYAEQATSPKFPNLALNSLIDWCDRRDDVDDTTLIRKFRQWVHDNLQGERPA